MSNKVYVPFWGRIGFKDDFVRAYTTPSNPSTGSITVLSRLTMMGFDVPMGVRVTTQVESSATLAQLRMLVNGSEVNAEIFTDPFTWKSVLTITPFSAKSATVAETIYSNDSVLESSTVTMSWNPDSINTIECDAFVTGAPSVATLSSSRATSVPAYIY